MQPTEQARAHSWHPQSLITLAQSPPAPPTIGGLLYPGKRTLLSGETESLKTWLALILTKAELAIGHPVAWVDLDDMGAGALLQRLRALNVPDEQTHDLFLYYTPDQRLYDVRTGRRVDLFADVLAYLLERQPRMMVIDAFNPILTLHGLDPNSVTDIEAFWSQIADPIAKTGAAPVLLDHVVKNADSRGKYSSGSERKASGATIHLGARPLEMLTIGGKGRAILDTHKDRPAYLPRPSVGTLILESIVNGDQETIHYQMQPDLSHATGSFRPTIIMEKISQTLEVITEPVTRNWIEKNVNGNNAAKRTALELLVHETYIAGEPGPRNSTLYTSSKPYRQADDDTLQIVKNDLAPTSPDLAQIYRPIDLASSPHPLRGGEVKASVDPAWAKSDQNGSNGDTDWLAT